MRDLGGEKLEEAVELLHVAPRLRDQRRRIGFGRLERAHLELQPVAEPLDAAEDANRIAFSEALVEEVDVVPHACVDSSARVDELECEIRVSTACS